MSMRSLKDNKKLGKVQTPNKVCQVLGNAGREAGVCPVLTNGPSRCKVQGSSMSEVEQQQYLHALLAVKRLKA